MKDKAQIVWCKAVIVKQLSRTNTDGGRHGRLLRDHLDNS